MRAKAGVVVVVLILVLCCRGAWAQHPPPGPSAGGPVPDGARVTLAFDHPEYFLGENVLAHFVVENVGGKPFDISQGGDYRGSSRSLRFQVTATDEAGQAAEDPDPNPLCMGGLANEPTIKPGGKFVVSVPLIRYCKFDHPGKYTVRISHDLGWKEVPGGRKPPVAEGTVTFRLPDAGQAEKIVERMEHLPEDPNVSQGERSPDYADFTALRQPVYLPALLRRAEHGKAVALEGIGHMETREATAALIQLANVDSARIALDAALTLNNRLPDPQFQGKLPARGPFDTSQVEERRRLSQRCWDDQFAPQVRAIAVRLLAPPTDGKGGPDAVTHHVHTMNGSLTRTEDDWVGAGAFMIEAVGTADDAPAVLAAMQPAIRQSMVPRHEPQDNILNDPAPLPELLRAMAVLHERGYVPGDKLSDDAQALVYFGGLEEQKSPGAQRWAEQFDAWITSPSYAVREAALRSIPQPPPEACVPKLRAALADKDLGVRRAACEVAGASGDPRFLPPLLKMIATENHEWLLRSATGAAQQLGAGFDLLRAWADRLGDEHLAGQRLDALALDSLQTVFDIPSTGWNGHSDLSRKERLRLRDAWREFLARHEQELRAGKRFRLDDPAVTPDLLGRARQLRFADGSAWPPDKEPAAR